MYRFLFWELMQSSAYLIIFNNTSFGFLLFPKSNKPLTEPLNHFK